MSHVMDKIETYQQILIGLLESTAQDVPINVKVIDNEVIDDTHRNHFQLLSVGWQDDNTFIHKTILHFDIKPDGKVWIQLNGTELDVAQELMDRGWRGKTS
jgi:XisI protein